MAAWSSSTGNASKHWELTGTRCLRLPTGGFSLWNKNVSGGSSRPPTAFLSVFVRIFCLWVIAYFFSVNLFGKVWKKNGHIKVDLTQLYWGNTVQCTVSCYIGLLPLSGRWSWPLFSAWEHRLPSSTSLLPSDLPSCIQYAHAFMHANTHTHKHGFAHAVKSNTARAQTWWCMHCWSFMSPAEPPVHPDLLKACLGLPPHSLPLVTRLIRSTRRQRHMDRPAVTSVPWYHLPLTDVKVCHCNKRQLPKQKHVCLDASSRGAVK